MKYLFLILVGFLLLACEKEEPYNICDDLGFEPNPKRFDKGFFVQGTLNGKSWAADNGGIVRSTDTLGNTTINVAFTKNNSCNLPDLIFYDFNTPDGFVLSHFYKINEININPPIRAAFNYGQIDEIVISQEYDSLSTKFENYIIFDYVAPDTSIVEGRFQFHLTKAWCTYFSDGTLQRCLSPDYQYGEPKHIIITDGKFRMKRER